MLEKIRLRKQIQMRDNAIIEAVMNDNFIPFLDYCLKYRIPIPANAEVFRGGVYKAAHEITTMPEEVKRIADEKVIAMGFKAGISEDFFAKENESSK